MTFTVVVTVYHRPELVAYVLSCLASQTWPDWDLIFVADGPQPIAGSIIADFCASSPRLASRIHYVACPSMPGHWGNGARALGLKTAAGDYTVFLGHDCIVFPEYLAAHAENIKQTPGCLSLVDVDVWVARNGTNPEVMLPHPHFTGVWPMRGRAIDALGVGEVDLTCMAFPTVKARELGVFGKNIKKYDADYFSAYLLCNRVLPVVHRPGVVAIHV